MRTDVVINFSVQNQGVVDVIWRQLRIEIKHCVRIGSSVLKKILRDHCCFAQFLAAFVENPNEQGFFSKSFAYVVDKLESRTGERVDGDYFAFVEPKPDSGVELTLNCVLAGYLWHALAMPAMTLMFFAPVFPFHFPPLDFCVRDRNDVLCQPFESLEWRFRWWQFGTFHAPNISFHRLERKTYTTDVPTATIIKSVRNSLPHSILNPFLD
jgi:hypothetical protein